MLKMALIIMVVMAIALIVGLFIYSFKLLRKAEKEQALAAPKQHEQDKQYQLHPKFKQHSNKDQSSKK
ncbi:hypothetical protein [Acinetobacter shaoyimingii]|uniref:DUF2897 family protein n=1 Tax=Acinetobacter shaoyimingii TaxID=2715164 RepID=A0A6G8RTW9_9GAMM|nr:hypothetical protein [Acinetobacter shaoyimingii]QIO05376.1 hypothetical protein G8E00_05110 [Acinetobacter shaoyimingii]